LTLKFVENIADGSLDGADTPGNNGLYSYPKNDNATGHDLRTGDGKGKIASQHQIYATPNAIEYYVSDENGELKKKNKNSYINAGSGVKKTIKIKV